MFQESVAKSPFCFTNVAQRTFEALDQINNVGGSTRKALCDGVSSSWANYGRYSINKLTGDATVPATRKSSRGDDQLITNVYYKPTDSHSYLNYSSFHPKKCRDSIPFSQFQRLRKLTTIDADYSTRSEEMSSFFLKQGYPAQPLPG